MTGGGGVVWWKAGWRRKGQI